jgi:hypothetical protein
MQDWQQEQMDFEMKFVKRIEDPDTPPKVYENPKDAWEVWEDSLHRFATAIACDALRSAFRGRPRREGEQGIDPLDVEIVISYKGKRRRVTFEEQLNPFGGDISI